MFTNYFKTAWRSLFKNKMTTLLNVGGLSVGMAAAVLIFLWVQSETSFDDVHPGRENIYQVTTSLTKDGWTWEGTPLLLADKARKELPEIDCIARIDADHEPVLNIDHKLSYGKKSAYVDHDWFKMFAYNFIEGNAAAFNQDDYGVILSASAAKKYFGSKPALGSVMRIDSSDFTVRAVVEDAVSNSSFQYDCYLPLNALLRNPERLKNDENWDNFNYVSFVKLKPKSDPKLTAVKLSGLLPDKSGNTYFSLIDLKNIHFETALQSSSFPKRSRSSVYVFSALGFLLLLIACINYVNLTTAKASLRAREVSVRKIVGADRSHLFYQFIAESLLISCVALVATMILVQVCLPYFNAFTGKDFRFIFAVGKTWLVIAGTLAIALVLNSIYPALLLSSFKPLQVFRGHTILKVKDAYFRKGLVVVQFTVSVMLIASTIIIYKQMNFIQSANPGYNRSQVLSFVLPGNIAREEKERFVKAVKNDLLSQSSIEAVSVANQSVINIGSVSTGSADWDGHDTTYQPDVSQLSADADYQKTMQLTMLEGRWFQDFNESDRSNVVLNETAVKAFKMHQPVVGQRFTFKGRTGQVIGVVKDFYYQNLRDQTGPLVAFLDPAWFNYFSVRVTPNKATQAVAVIKQTWKKMSPGNPLEYNFLDDDFNNMYQEDQKTSALILLFAIIAIVISSLGLFGLVAFTAEQRTKEIGIRKVLGATVFGITTLLSKDFVKLVGIAIVIASPIAFWAMNKWIQDFAYRIDITWWMFAAAGLVALLVAMITTSVQAIKAAVANPVRSLRSE